MEKETMTMVEKDYLEWAGHRIAELEARIKELEAVKAERDALVGFAIDVINGDPTIEDAKIYKALPERLRKQIEGGE